MADVTFGPQDYTSTLAMLNHEAGNAISALLKSGRNADAMGYVGGLIDTWGNRAASTGRTMWQEMNRSNQISFWDPSTGAIQSKANALDPRIKGLADAYLQQRASGAPNAVPGSSFYLNKDLVEATPSYGTKYKAWYDPGTVVQAYGDKRGGGKASLETQFVRNDKEYKVPEYKFSLDRALQIAPSEAGLSAYNEFTGLRGLGYDPAKSFNSGLQSLDVSQGVGVGSLGVGGVGFMEPANGPGDFLGGGGGNFPDVGGVITTSMPAIGADGFGAGTNVSGGNPNGSLGVGAPGYATPTFGPGDALGVGNFRGFDRDQYLQANQDVAQSGQDPIEHYLRYGAKENRALTLDGQRFDGQAYLAANQDVARAGMSPVQHYLEYGAKEGRLAQTVGPGGIVSPIDDFLSVGTQLPSNYAQLVEASFAPTVGAGAATGTQGPAPLTPTQGPGQTVQAFDGEQYLAANKDVSGSGMSAVDHYLRYGAKEDRALTLDGVKFDKTAYLAKNQDVASAGMDPIRHYLEFGAKEGRLAELAAPRMVSTQAPLFGSTQMPANYAELVKASFAPTQGPGMVSTQGPATASTQGPGATASTQGPAMTGTVGVPSWFNSADYFNANGDVKASGQDAFSHFKNFGASEGRALNLDGVHFGSKAYLAANPDVAGAGMSPIQHYLDYGSKEGRASPLVDNDSAAADVGAFGFSGMSAGVFGPPGGGGGGSAPAARTPPPGFLSEAQQTSQRSQDNVFAIQANDARNSALGQEAAAMARNSIGVGAPNISFNPQVFNPGSQVVSNQPAISVAPTVAAPAGPAFALNLSPGAMPGGGFRAPMSGFR